MTSLISGSVTSVMVVISGAKCVLFQFHYHLIEGSVHGIINQHQDRYNDIFQATLPAILYPL